MVIKNIVVNDASIHIVLILLDKKKLYTKLGYPCYDWPFLTYIQLCDKQAFTFWRVVEPQLLNSHGLSTKLWIKYFGFPFNILYSKDFVVGYFFAMWNGHFFIVGRTLLRFSLRADLQNVTSDHMFYLSICAGCHNSHSFKCNFVGMVSVFC